MTDADAGFLPSGHPYNRFGAGSLPLVVFTGLTFEHRPAAGFELRITRGPLRPLEQDYTIWVLNRPPGLQPGTTIADMADEYADLIRSQFGGPVDLVGVSTGGSIALQCALDHPELVRHLVIYSSAYRLGDVGRDAQARLGRLARRRRWGDVFSELMAFLFLPREGIGRTLTRPVRALFYVMGRVMVRGVDPADMVVTIEAEDRFDVGDRLGEIRAPTLVVGGARDPFYSTELFEGTARGIPGGRLHLEPAGGHVPTGPAVTEALRTFLASP